MPLLPHAARPRVEFQRASARCRDQECGGLDRVAMSHSSPALAVLKQKCQQASSQKKFAANYSTRPALLQVSRMHFRFVRLIVAARISSHDEHGMNAANTRIRCI